MVRTLADGASCWDINRDGNRGTFYPFFSVTGNSQLGGCRRLIGNDVLGLTATDSGQVSEYGQLLPLQYLAFGGGGATLTRFNDFQHNLESNPCKA